MSETPLLSADGICRSYTMGRARLEVLRGCSLRVAAGEFLAVMGKSGSGKSTLLHILGALDVPQRGQVSFRGQSVFPPEEQRQVSTSLVDVFAAHERRRIALRRREFGFVFQFYHLLPELNVLENVLLPRMVELSFVRWLTGAAAARRDAREILKRVGLAERLTHRPNELSGGERQRVAVARALVHSPKVLLADEPTGNLDSETGERLMDMLGGFHHEGQTIVMVTHDSSVARHADRILEIRDGTLVPA